MGPTQKRDLVTTSSGEVYEIISSFSLEQSLQELLTDYLSHILQQPEKS